MGMRWSPSCHTSVGGKNVGTAGRVEADKLDALVEL